MRIFDNKRSANLRMRLRYLLFGLASIAVSGFTLQGCSSSSSNGGTDTNVPFSDPIDTTTLTAALSTGAPGEQNTENWECALDDGNVLLSYKLFNDGTGVGTNLVASGVQSNFTWRATSSSTMVTTATATGIMDTLTDIKFSGSNAMRLTAGEGLLLLCERKGVVIEPAGSADTAENNAVTYGGVAYPLTHGHEIASRFRAERDDTHRNYQFRVADSNFRQIFITDAFGNNLVFWRHTAANVSFRAIINSPGGEDFQTGVFEYASDDVDPKGAEVAGKFYYTRAFFGIDLDGVDGIDDDANEFSDVVGGTITITRGEGIQAQLSFDVVLEDGSTVSGSFSGEFPRVDNI